MNSINWRNKIAQINGGLKESLLYLGIIFMAGVMPVYGTFGFTDKEMENVTLDLLPEDPYDKLPGVDLNLGKWPKLKEDLRQIEHFMNLPSNRWIVSGANGDSAMYITQAHNAQYGTAAYKYRWLPTVLAGFMMRKFSMEPYLAFLIINGGRASFSTLL